MAEEVAEQGINVEVVADPAHLSLISELIFESVKKTGKLMLVNDAYKTGGFIRDCCHGYRKCYLITLTTQLYAGRRCACTFGARVWNKRFFHC